MANKRSSHAINTHRKRQCNANPERWVSADCIRSVGCDAGSASRSELPRGDGRFTSGVNIYGTDVRCVVAAGGDGTVASVINELAPDGAACEGSFCVSNLPEYARALSFTPAARGDDGVLDWLAFERRGLPALAGYAWAVTHARHHALAHARSGRARRLTLTSAAPVPVRLDGDPWGFTPAEVEVLPAALRVVVA